MLNLFFARFSASYEGIPQHVILFIDQDGAVDWPRRVYQDHAVLDRRPAAANVQIKSPTSLQDELKKILMSSKGLKVNEVL